MRGLTGGGGGGEVSAWLSNKVSSKENGSPHLGQFFFTNCRKEVERSRKPPCETTNILLYSLLSCFPAGHGHVLGRESQTEARSKARFN